MDKRRGPLLWIASRSRRFWYALILLPPLYVASLPVLFWMHRQFGVFPYRTLAGKLFHWYLSPVSFIDGWLPPSWHNLLWTYLLLLSH